MKKESKFFQFPIGALYFGKPITEVSREEASARLNDIIAYCVVEVGNKLYEGDQDPLIEAANATSWPHAAQDDTELVILAGCGTLGVKPHNVHFGTWNSEWQRIEDLRKYGTQNVRLRADIVFDAKDDTSGELSWREFATLAAVYSAIGGYKLSRITYARIGCLAIGFNGQRSRDKFKAAKYQLTDRQTKYTVEQLRRRGFFASASPNRRHMYYSKTLTLPELMTALVDIAKKRQKQSPSDITKQIQERINAAS